MVPPREAKMAEKAKKTYARDGSRDDEERESHGR